MPYSPGVEDRSGQLRAQGKLAQIGGIAEGVANGFLAYQQNKLRNQALQGENDGLMKVFSQDPEMAKYAPEGIDKFLQKAQSGGGLTLDDNIRLNGMLNTAIKTKGAIQQQALQEQQIKMSQMQQQAVASQMQAVAAQMQQEKNDESALAAALRQFNPQQPTPELNMSGLRPAPAGAPMLDASGLEPAPDASPSARAQFDPAAFLRVYSEQGGSPRSIEKVDNILKMLAQPKQGKAMQIGEIRGKDANGNPTITSVNQLTGEVLGPESPVTQPPRPYRTAQEEYDAEQAKKTGEEDAKNTAAVLAGVRDQAEVARMTKADVQLIKDLYEQGAQSGFGQEFLTKGAAMLSRLGYGDVNSLANQQALDTTLNRFVLSQAKVLGQGQGAMSDFERRLFEQSTANPNRSREANLMMLDVIKGVADRAEKMDEERLKLEDQGVSKKDIARRMERMRAELPIPGLQALARMGSDNGGGAKATTSAPVGVGGWTPEKEAAYQAELKRREKQGKK